MRYLEKMSVPLTYVELAVIERALKHYQAAKRTSQQHTVDVGLIRDGLTENILLAMLAFEDEDLDPDNDNRRT